MMMTSASVRADLMLALAPLGPDSGSHHALGLLKALDVGRGVDVRDVGSDTGGASDVVQSERSDEGVGLEEEGHGLSDSTGGTEDGDASLGSSGGGKAPSGEHRGGSDGLSGEHGVRGVFGGMRMRR